MSKRHGACVRKYLMVNLGTRARRAPGILTGRSRIMEVWRESL